MSVVTTVQAGPLRPGVLGWAGGAMLMLCVASGCGKKDEATSAAAPSAATTGTAPSIVAPPVQAVSPQVAALTADQLREAAGKALSEQRLYAPAGNNAMEYYLALRGKQAADPAVASALSDLMPYTLIATEQSISREDFVEAQRLYALMDLADKQAPALPRLKQSIADAQVAVTTRAAAAQAQTIADADKQKKLEADRAAQQLLAQQAAAQQLATQQATDQQAAAQRAVDARAAEQRAAAEAQAAQQRAAATATADAAPPRPAAAAPAAGAAAAPTAAAATAPAATPSASAELRAVSTPAPRYPPEALRAAQGGEVQVEFTVAPDGSVSSARVVRSNPPRVFDREAVAAVRRWRFQPVSAPVTTRRTIGFKPTE